LSLSTAKKKKGLNQLSNKSGMGAGMVVYTCSPSTWEAEAGAQEFEASQCNTVRFCLKKKKKERGGVTKSCDGILCTVM
jgi:hypothetical protein